MGYPMTFKRLLNRNKIYGDYGMKLSLLNLEAHKIPAVNFQSSNSHLRHIEDRAESYAVEIKSINGRWGALCGDAARLVRDAQDENYLCKYIAQRTGVDADTVAIVLKEFVEF